MSAVNSRCDALPSAILSRMEQQVRYFEDAWRAGQRPTIEQFLLPDEAGRLPCLIELIHVELELRLKAGEAARIESYLQRYPQLAGDPTRVVELVAAEYQHRRRQEPLLGPEEYLSRFPAYRAAIQRQFGLAPDPVPLPSNRATLRVTFRVTAGPHQGQLFRFEGHDTFLVGRSKQAHFRLPQKDEYFSRIHFLVEVNPPQCRLLDMGSTNGTYVNGQRISVLDLHDGDRIEGGQTVLTVALETVPEGIASGSARLPQPERAPPPAAAPPANQETIVRPSRADPLGCPFCPGAAEPRGQAPAWLCETCVAEAGSQPQPIRGYRIVRELGRGGMGVVYLAQQQADGRRVALKTIQPTGDVSQAEILRFLREANILRQLAHPHIVAFHEMGEANGRLFLAMDYVPGTDAARLLKAQGPLPVPRAVSLICQILEALADAHGRGFVHRDVKPANLLVSTESGREVARLADFGLARVYQESKLSGLTLLGQMGGTLAFMAPEQVYHFREAQPPVDQYAAAATLYNLLTDRFLFDFPPEPQQRLLLILQGEPVPLRTRRPGVPEGLAAVVQRALVRDPGGRFADVAAFRAALLPWMESVANE